MVNCCQKVSTTQKQQLKSRAKNKKQMLFVTKKMVTNESKQIPTVFPLGCLQKWGWIFEWFFSSWKRFRGDSILTRFETQKFIFPSLQMRKLLLKGFVHSYRLKGCLMYIWKSAANTSSPPPVGSGQKVYKEDQKNS